MAGQGNFRPNYNYTFNSYDSMNPASLGVPSEDNQPMFPVDYRQYLGNPVFPSTASAPETNFAFDRTQPDIIGLNFSTQSFSDQVPADYSGITVKTSEAGNVPENVRNFCVQGNASVAASYSKSTVTKAALSKDSQDRTFVDENVIEADQRESYKTSIIDKANIKVESAKDVTLTEPPKETYVKKELESDAEEFEKIDKGGHATESNSETLDKADVDNDVLSVPKRESISDDENIDGEEDDDENTSDVSDASTIIEDEEEITDKIKKKEKTSKEQNKGSRKKPRKQTLPKPVKPVDKKEYTCETCAKVVQSLRALIKHRNLHTDKYKCEECGKIFNSEVSLKNHHKVHSGFIGTEVCNVCDKTFYDRSSLNKHTLSVHMGIKNFQCEYCNMSFFAKKTYEEHVRVHTGERPFKCTQCPKSYKRISDLNHHLRLHSGEVSHTCEKCGEGFRRVSELNRHMTKHTGETFIQIQRPKPKRCSWCGLTFSTTKALNKHFNSHMESVGASQIDVQNPVQFDQNKMKLVDEIVQDLGTNLIGPELSNIENKEKFLPNPPDIVKDLNFQAEPRLNMNVFPYTGIDMTYRNMTAEQDTGKECEMNDLSAGTLETAEGLKTDKEAVFDFKNFPGSNKDTNKLPVTDLCQSKDIETEDKKNLENKECQIEGEKNEGGPDFDEEKDSSDKDKLSDNVKIEIEMDYDDRNDDYAGDTDVEDYDYVLNSSPLNKETFQKNTDQIINIKVEAEPDEYDDDKDDKNADSKDDEKKDPDFLPTSERTRKRKAALPRRKVVKRKLIKKEGESMDEIVDNEEEKKKEKKKRKSKSVTKPVHEDASMDLDALKCLQCGKFFAKKVSLIKHMNLHRGTYSCEICRKCFSTKRSLEIHVDNHEGRKVNTALCNVCDKAFYDASSLNKHVKTVHMDYKPFPCTLCDRRFSENKTLVEHLRVHTGERPFACEVCGKTYKRASELNFHLRKHNGEVNLNCPECGKGFMRMGQLRQHMLLRHDKERPFRCFLCAKTFPTHPMLKDHQKIHVNQRKHVCERCGYKFHTRSKLEKHLKRKTDCQAHIYKNMNGMFVCKFCHGEFSTVDDRKAHIDQVHQDDATFPCEVCGKHFRRSQALKIHLKIHYQVRDYKCTMCSAAFIQRHHLTQHIATHTGSRPYQCNICLKNFAHNATLYNHMKHH